MKINTRLFGEVDIADDKVLHFANGIIGLENLKQFVLIYDSEKEDGGVITWLQSVDEKDFALPIINPNYIIEGYNPIVEDELLAPLGVLEPDKLMVFTVLRVPSDITKMTANLKAPIVIHLETKEACQIVVQNEEYEVKHPVYEALKVAKERVGD
ncbi:MAG: flagellar assembly protein FliW [Lachnospiraceae bacterium]|nr:flagellar assembly protein FliW [Lachnospiraceae bacterium]